MVLGTPGEEGWRIGGIIGAGATLALCVEDGKQGKQEEEARGAITGGDEGAPFDLVFRACAQQCAHSAER